MKRHSKRSHEASVDGQSDPRGAQVLHSARQTLALALEDARDPVLARASLLDVAPHPDASCLRLVVSADASELDATRDALARAKSWLRSELAADLDRRRTPELVFTVVAREDA
jgi:ribosome-binding factor A